MPIKRNMKIRLRRSTGKRNNRRKMRKKEIKDRREEAEKEEEKTVKIIRKTENIGKETKEHWQLQWSKTIVWCAGRHLVTSRLTAANICLS